MTEVAYSATFASPVTRGPSFRTGRVARTGASDADEGGSGRRSVQHARGSVTHSFTADGEDSVV